MKRHGDALDEYSRFIKTCTKVLEVINFLVTARLVHTKVCLFIYLFDFFCEKRLTWFFFQNYL